MKSTRANDPVSRYILDLQQRYPQFQREHQQELREIGADPFTRIYQQYFLIRTRTDFESQLHSLLSPEERDRLQIDQTFTKAWHIFIDMCWVKKRIATAVIIVGLILIVFAALAFTIWALPYLLNSTRR